MPEWYLLSAVLCFLGCMGFLWSPLLWCLPAFALSVIIVILQAAVSAKKNSALPPRLQKKYKYHLMIVVLHMVQPVARLYGRFTNGLTPWRKRGAGLHTKFLFVTGSRVFPYWSETWRSTEEWLTMIEQNLLALRTRIKKGDVFDNWDIEVKTGLFAKSRCLLTVEEHGAGKEYLKLKCRPVFSVVAFFLPAVFLTLSVLAGFQQQWIVVGITGLAGLILLLNVFVATATSLNNLYSAFNRLAAEMEPVNGSKPVVKTAGRPLKFIPLNSTKISSKT